jgi:SAM-dependent methyltransferase
MRRPRPVSDEWGFDRGQPVDRYYIDRYLGRFSYSEGYAAGDVRGHVCEVGGDEYARRFGRFDGPEPMTRLDVLHVSAANPAATLVGDLVTGEGIPDAAFDCILCIQTLHVIYEIGDVVRTLHRALRPGGVAFVTVPGITPACTPDRDLWGDYWRFTATSAQRLFSEVFGSAQVRVDAYGNLLSAMAFLQGMAAQELAPWELDLRDPGYEVILGIRAARA